MAINKVTHINGVSIDPSTTHTGHGKNLTYVGYAQRAGEAGLTQRIVLLLDGWEIEEAEDFADFLNRAIHTHLVSLGRRFG